ncbi:MAG: hypothetical protein HY074_00765 [Deltaproteobacteria bacterium]|nr:hypothetical protein [Deltaproteobacteria bacterium]
MTPIITRFTALASLTLLSLSATVALAQSRAPDSEGTAHPYYRWEVPLDRETKAVVGPVDAEREIKLRLDRPDSDSAMNFPDESIIVCIERYCETVDLVPGGDLTAKSPEIDFTAHITAVPGDYRKTYLTIQRKNHAATETVNLSIKVETDHTGELPQFTVLTGVQPKTLENAARQHSLEHDGMDIKAVDVTLPAAGDTIENKAIAQ